MTIDGKNEPAAAAGADARTRYPHAAVWLDHFHAVIVFVAPDAHRTVRLESEREDTRLHRKSGAPGSGRLPVDTQFFDRVAEELAAHAADVLVAGPGNAKNEFRRSVEKRQPSLAARIVDVVTLDHPSDGELTEFARREFRRIDQLGLSNS
jgi:stalled ribosome rescue protein Dom34